MQIAKGVNITKLQQPIRALVSPEAALLGQENGLRSDYLLREWNALERMARYVSQTLTTGDNALGRPGPVCPFTPAALRLNLLTLTVSTLNREEKMK